MKSLISKILLIVLLFFSVPIYSACSSEQIIKLYNTDTKKIEKLKLEDYIAGVVAGEMYNDWPIEALKTQSILARTFTLNFITNKKSKYNGADISTDITEAQAYVPDNINDRIKQAVSETNGLVIKYNDDLINAWFHSNSGGMTELATVGLNYNDENPAYIQSISSVENSTNSLNYEWEYAFTKSEVLNALSTIGLTVSTITNISIGEQSKSGRALNINIGNKSVNTNTFRLAIGSTRLKSTLIKEIIINNDNILFKGLGYGHGVGVSQWGSKILAEQGKDYNYIINYYFKNIKIVKI